MANEPAGFSWANLIPIVGQGMAAVANSQQQQQQQKLLLRQLDMQKQQQQWGQGLDTLNAQRTLDSDAAMRANQNATSPMRAQLANAMAAKLGMGQMFSPPQGQAGFTPQQLPTVQQAKNPLVPMQQQQGKEYEETEIARLRDFLAKTPLRGRDAEAAVANLRAKIAQKAQPTTAGQNYMPLGGR